MSQQIIQRLIKALEPFADLLEDPENWREDLASLWVCVSDIIEAKAALREAAGSEEPDA